MKHSLHALALVLVFSALALMAGAAFASEAAAVPVPEEFSIHLSSGLQSIVSLIFGLIGGGLAFLSGKLFGAGGKLPLDDEHRAYIDNAIAHGLTLAEAKVRDLAGGINDPTVKNQTVATAANFVLASIPTVLVKYGITPDKLRDMVTQKLESGTNSGGADA